MSSQPDLFTVAPRFDGPCYDPALDQDRLSKQIGRVYAALQGGRWLTLREVATATGDPESSVSAQLRHLRKARFGSHQIDRRIRGDRGHGLYEYRLVGVQS